MTGQDFLLCLSAPPGRHPIPAMSEIHRYERQVRICVVDISADIARDLAISTVVVTRFAGYTSSRDREGRRLQAPGEGRRGHRATSQMCPLGSLKLAVRGPHGRSIGPLSRATPLV